MYIGLCLVLGETSTKFFFNKRRPRTTINNTKRVENSRNWLPDALHSHFSGPTVNLTSGPRYIQTNENAGEWLISLFSVPLLSWQLP